MTNKKIDMTLRDYFAAKALPSCYEYWIRDYYHPDISDSKERSYDGRDDLDEGMMNIIATDAYLIANAMLKAREA